MKQIVSFALIVCGLTEAAAPAFAQQPSGTTVTITSMDRGSLRPFDRLVITGSGFQPASSAISVLFVPKQHGLPIAIPVFSATATTVEVIVPPFLDPAAGDFGFGQADVQVVQVSRDSVMSSNVLSGLDVAPVPSLPASVGAGRVTRGFMRVSLEFLSKAMETATPETRAALSAFKDEQAALVAQVEAIVAKPASGVAARTIDATPLVVSGPMLKAADRLLVAYLTSLAPFVKAARDDRALAPAALDCSPDADNGELDAMICSFRTGVLAASKNWLTGAAVAGAGVGVLLTYATAGAAFAAPAAAIGGLLVLAGAAQIIYLCATTTLTTATSEGGAPPLMETLKDHGRKILENANDTAGTAITTASTLASDALTKIAERLNTTPGSAPKGGTILGAPRVDPAATNREMVIFQGGGRDATATRIGVSSTQSSKTLFESRVAPADISAFDGTYAGVVNWFATDGEENAAGSAGVAFVVVGGRSTTSAPIGGTGSVSASGRVTGTAAGGGVSCGYTGALEAKTATGAASGGGVFQCKSSEGTAWGAWSAGRGAK